MTFTIDKLAKTLQTLFTTEADTAAKESGMIQRRRKISGAGFVQSLVFGWLDDPTTTIDELGDELDVTKQGLDQRLDARAADCLWRVVKKALHRLFAASPETIPLLRRFTGVVIDDCTSLGLPAELARRFPGCGGSDPEAGQAGLKLLVRFEVSSGQFQALEAGAARLRRRAGQATAAVALGEPAPGRPGFLRPQRADPTEPTGHLLDSPSAGVVEEASRRWHDRGAGRLAQAPASRSD